MDINIGSGTLVFPSGGTPPAEITVPIIIPITDDLIAESNEIFQIELTSSEATISIASAEVTIIDNDGESLKLLH